ncbi:unnamed protein product, partial [Didymodactylos carnosus]
STRLQQDVETSNLEEKYSKELSLLNLEYEKMLKSCIRSQRLYMDLKQNFETIEEKNGQLKGWCESTDKEKSIMKQTETEAIVVTNLMFLMKESLMS